MSDLKRAAAAAAVDLVEDGMALGLGTGSTAALFVDLLGERVRAGLRVTGVPTSEATAAQAARLGIPLAELGPLDLTVDGADEIAPDLSLIKGAGGALLREKIVAAASARMVVIADGSKLVEALGACALPIEIVRFGATATEAAVAEVLAAADVATGGLALRMRDGAPYATDENHLILDATCGRIGDPSALDAALRAIPGVVETGLFLGLATGALVATGNDVQWLGNL